MQLFNNLAKTTAIFGLFITKKLKKEAVLHIVKDRPIPIRPIFFSLLFKAKNKTKIFEKIVAKTMK